jgi:predicted AAA+ superfamily ATPase
MDMERKITEQLLAWKNSNKRMPLLLNGARQVGKTYILKEFGRLYYKNTVHINLETNVSINSYFDRDISPQRIVEFLEITANERIIPDETLLILDEIQSSERALLSLKTFCEEAPQYHIAAAGSLLGVALNREKYSFPVGKVDELTLFPLDFEEYLWALNKRRLAEEIRSHFLLDRAMPAALHEEALEIYRKYLVTGGMPAVVNRYVDSGSLVDTVSVQQQIINEYIADMAKYATPATSVKIRACYNSIPAQLAKENRKFQYKIVQRGATATLFGESIEWLNFAGIVLKCQKTASGNIPVAAYSELSDFKLYMGDVGILTMKSGMPSQVILLNAGEENTFMGALTENYVAQALASNKIPLYYWKNDNSAEVDFLMQKENRVIPIEVKKGLHIRSKSLHIFVNQYNCPYAIRISQKNFGFENNIKSVPLYAVYLI